jgi:hypothetical protein
MVRIEEVRDFAVERSAAFDYITEPNNWDRYWPGLVSVADLPTARWSVRGDVMRLRMRLLGRAVELHMTLDTMDRPNRVAYHTVQAGLPDTDHERLFEPCDDGFRYRLRVSYRPRRGFVAALLDRSVVRLGIRRALRTTLDNLARCMVQDRVGDAR